MESGFVRDNNLGSVKRTKPGPRSLNGLPKGIPRSIGHILNKDYGYITQLSMTS